MTDMNCFIVVASLYMSVCGMGEALGHGSSESETN
mgnify:CR=1 FL=1